MGRKPLHLEQGTYTRNEGKDMPKVPFEDLPDTARLWTFAASETLSMAQQDALVQTVDAFLDTWRAHGQPLTCARELRHDRFLLVAVDEVATDASGCSIDALVHQVRGLEQELGVTMTDNAPVWYRDGGTVRCATRQEFREMAQRGGVQSDTIVFNNTVQSVGAVRGGKWEVPARESWHGRVFFDGMTE